MGLMEWCLAGIEVWISNLKKTVDLIHNTRPCLTSLPDLVLIFYKRNVYIVV